jgi:hypothetical protein
MSIYVDHCPDREYLKSMRANKTYLTSDLSDWVTFPLAAAAYGKRSTLPSLDQALTHSFNPKEDKVLCGKVKPESVLDDYTYDTTEIPTCKVCAERLWKIAGKWWNK